MFEKTISYENEPNGYDCGQELSANRISEAAAGVENEKVTDSGLQERYEKYRCILQDITIMSDVFMRNVLKKRDCTEYILQTIMGKKNLKVLDQVLQKDYKNLQGRSAMLDCVAKDDEGNRFNIEIQQENQGASPKRARYHSGLMDMNTLNPGQDFDGLPESYVIFITRNDVLRYDLPIYHIEREIKEVSENFGDGSHIIYVNSKKQEDTELGKLMHDLHCKKAGEMYSEVLAKRVYELKETQEGVDCMCREMDQLYSEGVLEGIEQGIEQGIVKGEMKKAKEIAISLAAMGLSVEKIAQVVSVSVKGVQEWVADSMSVAR